MSDPDSASPTPLRNSTNSPSPMDLTPRSKVHAMLAALDADSEDEAPQLMNPTSIASRHVSEPKSLLLQSEQSDNGNSEEEEPTRKPAPKGRTAARMQAEIRNDSSDDDDDNAGSGVNAYQRIRERLMAGKTEKSSDVEKLHTAPAQVTSDEDEDEPPTRANRHRTILPSSRTPSPRKSRSPAPASPGLFLSPDKSPHMEGSRSRGRGTDSDSPQPTKRHSALEVLVARKRAERLAKEKAIEEETQREEELFRLRKEKTKKTRRVMAESESDGDSKAGKRLTQQARPTRKASKKALEEMNRETQRLSRNMQLTYVAKTKTKVTLDDFLSNFNKHAPNTDSLLPTPEHDASSSVHGDETGNLAGTPPSSPPSVGPAITKRLSATAFKAPTKLQLNGGILEDNEVDDEELPSLDEAMTQQQLEQSKLTTTLVPPEISTKSFSIRKFEKSKKQPTRTISDSEDDLEIVKPGAPSRFAIFDQMPERKARESSSIHALRALANLNGNQKPPVRKGKASMTPSELHTLLNQRAREQADNERNEKIQALRDKGILVQSAEEKERDQLQLENMLEKARQEGKALADKEKADAKKDGKNVDADGELPDDDDEDEDWKGSGEEDAEVVLSGSEDEEVASDTANKDSAGEEDDDQEENEDTSNAEAKKALFDDEAAVDEEEREEEDVGIDEAEVTETEIDTENEDVTHQTPSTFPKRARAARKTIVESDDEDEPVLVDRTPQRQMLTTPKASIADAFGFARTTPAPLGLSQMFAGTMADSQADDAPSSVYDNEQDSLQFLRTLPEPQLFGFTTANNDSQDDIVQDSQSAPPLNTESQVGAMLHFESQSQKPSQMPFDESQMSDFPELTQDAALQIRTQPIGSRMFQPSGSYSTTATVPTSLVENSQSPIVKKKGRLLRGNEVAREPTQEIPMSLEEVVTDDEDVDNTNDAFAIMRKASKKPEVTEYDKKKSTAKGMVEEQAEESEDEYAGLGGASDDESQGEFDEETLKMIDDESNEKLNERDVAAFFADKEREDDEKRVEKLYKDIANGGLRRKRGAERGDLWDSDDEDEAAARRRAAKQREFARMRKALLADEKIGKIAENPKQQAFLKAIEDLDDDDDLAFLDQAEEAPSQSLDSQSQSQALSQPAAPLRPTAANTAGRKTTAANDSQEMPPPPLPRRANKYTKPTSLADIRDTLSDLIGAPDSAFAMDDLDFSDHSISDAEDVETQNDDENAMDVDVENNDAAPRTTNPRRTLPDASHTSVIDRIALKRMASSTLSNANDRLAFHSASRGSESSFRVPSLLRRVTSASDAGSNSGGIGVTGNSMALGAVGKGGVRMGGSKKSSVGYYGRGDERKAKLERIEKERMEERVRVGKMRREGPGLGSFMGGSWE